MNGELTIFPKDGWCPSANKNLGKYLSVKFEQEYISPGVQGYAWNHCSYWTIDTESGKEKYSIYSLLGIVRKFVKKHNLMPSRNPAPEDPHKMPKHVREYPLTTSECFKEIYKLNRKKLLLRRSRR